LKEKLKRKRRGREKEKRKDERGIRFRDFIFYGGVRK